MTTLVMPRLPEIELQISTNSMVPDGQGHINNVIGNVLKHPNTHGSSTIYIS
jgi:hypothetical protein